MRWCSLLIALVACGCATLTPEGARVTVYRAPLEADPSKRSMPEGCRLVTAQPAVSMPEMDLDGQKDPFRRERNAEGASGANVLLVLSRMTAARQETDCPPSSPITDCPPSFGAWFKVVVESYSCTPDALRILSPPAKGALQN